MSELIEKMANETGHDWFSILMALRDRGIVSAAEARKIESYFFDVGK